MPKQILRTRAVPVMCLSVMIFLSARAAESADLMFEPDPVPVPDVAPDPEGFDWNRFYGGVVGGYAQGSAGITNTFGNSFFTGNPDISGGFFGLTAGRNFTPRGNFVFGIEGDIAYAQMRASANGTFIIPTPIGVPGPDIPPLAQSYTVQINTLATLRGRLGIAMGRRDRFLPFVTAGYAGAYAKASTSQETFPPPSPLTGSGSKWLNGFVVGGGLEFAVSDRVTLKSEYLYTDLQGTITTTTSIGDVNFNIKSNHQFRLGLNVHY